MPTEAYIFWALALVVRVKSIELTAVDQPARDVGPLAFFVYHCQRLDLPPLRLAELVRQIRAFSLRSRWHERQILAKRPTPLRSYKIARDYRYSVVSCPDFRSSGTCAATLPEWNGARKRKPENAKYGYRSPSPRSQIRAHGRSSPSLRIMVQDGALAAPE